MKYPRICLHLDGSLCLLLALMLLILPLTWVFAAILAAAIHELCHIAAIYALGGRIYTLSLGTYGARMETEPLPPGRELLASLAGPLGSAMLMLLAGWLPRLAICGMVHCVYNLLPLYPMDGGRALKNLLMLCLPNQYHEGIFQIIQRIIWILLFFCLLLGFRWGIWPVAVMLMLLWRQRKARTV